MQNHFLNIIGCCLVIFFSILGCEKSIQPISEIPTITFQKIFTKAWLNYSYSIAETYDGFIIGAIIYPQSNMSSAVSLIKTNDRGEIIWIKLIETEKGGVNNKPTKIIVVEDGFIVVGRTYVEQGVALWMFKTDFNGNQLWSKTIRQKEGGEANDVIQTEDGFIVVGEIVMSWSFIPFGNLHQNGWILRFDRNGNIISNVTLGDSSYSKLSFIEKTSYGFLTVGATTKIDKSSSLWIVALDNQGKFLWEKIFSQITPTSQFMKDRDGSIVLSLFLTGDSLRNVSLMKISEYGELIWNRNTQQPSFVVSMARTKNNDYALLGEPKSTQNYFSLLRFDMNGNIKLEKKFTYNIDSVRLIPKNIIATKDNGFAIIGNIYEQDTTKIFFYKTDSFGEFK